MKAAVWLFLGVFGCSTAVILIKESALDPALLSALRLLLAALLLCNLAQFLFAGALAWALFGELPKPAFWPAAALIIAGAVTSLFSGPRPELSSGGAPAPSEITPSQ